MSEVIIKTSKYHVHQEVIDLGIAKLVPMRIEIDLPKDADWKTPYDKLAQMFKICQYEKDENGRDVVPFGKHDLHFWCSCIPQEHYRNDYRHVHLTFNDKKSVEDRYSDMEKLVSAIREVFTECEARIEYHDEIDHAAAHEMAERRFAELQGKKVVCPSRDSIIIICGAPEPVGTLIRFNSGSADDIGKSFAFKKLRSRKYVYPRTDVDICFAKEVA